MPRVVVDLNVVVSGLIRPRGASRAVLRAALARQIAIAVCPRWAGELRAVTRPRPLQAALHRGGGRDLVDGLPEVGEAHPDPPVVPA